MDSVIFYINNVILSPDKGESIFSLSNITAFGALIISLFTIYFSFRIIYRTKQLDIKNQKFDNLCIKNIDSILSHTDELFEVHALSLIHNHRQDITSTLVDLQLLVVSIRDTLYPNLDIPELISIIETFSDEIYNTNSTILSYKGLYLRTKLNIYNELYGYASLNEFEGSKVFHFLKKT